jgi:mRNA-degrading endonuclease RelE of RelBE toxin-antitoxin system
MKEIVITPSAKISLRTLEDKNRRRVLAWFDQLANWDADESVRRHSRSLDSMPGVYMLVTRTDYRVFFRIDGNTVTILDIANKHLIEAFAKAAEAK